MNSHSDVFVLKLVDLNVSSFIEIVFVVRFAVVFEAGAETCASTAKRAEHDHHEKGS